MQGRIQEIDFVFAKNHHINFPLCNVRLSFEAKELVFYIDWQLDFRLNILPFQTRNGIKKGLIVTNRVFFSLEFFSLPFQSLSVNDKIVFQTYK